MKKDDIDTSCPVCLVDHDDEIHEATVSLHSWFRKKIRTMLKLQEVLTGAERA